MLLIDRIRTIQTNPHTTMTDRLIANYLMNNAPEIVHKGIREVAREAGVSPSSVMRFTNKMGFRGYADFRTQFNIEYVSTLQNGLSDAQRLEALSRFLAQQLSEHILAFNTHTDFGILDLAVKRLRDSDHIAIFAEDSLLECAYPFKSALLSLGYKASIELTPVNKLNEAASLTPNDTAIVITGKPENKLLLNIVETLHTNEVPIINLSQEPNNHISQAADYFIPLEPFSTDATPALAVSLVLELILAYLKII